MATSRLSIYNGALEAMSERALASLTEDRDVRYTLDFHWNDGAGLVASVLEEGYWKFAMRTSKFLANPNITPPFGPQYAFTKPDDYVKTAAVSLNEFFTMPYTQYDDEAGNWFAFIDTLYIKYISNDAQFGSNFARWPQSFTRLAELYLAKISCNKITKSDKIKKDVMEDFEKALRSARAKDALNDPAKFMPAGSWVRSRMSNRYGSVPNGLFNGNGSRDY